LDQENSVDTSIVITHDLFPTILQYAGVNFPQDHIVDGVVLGESESTRVIGWHQPHQWGAPGPGIEPFTAIRQGKWKLIFFHDGRRFELYDLEVDIGETVDLSEKTPEVLMKMQRLLNDWATERKAQPSILKETGKPVLWKID